MDMGIISELNFLSFKANTKTGILIVTFGNVKVTAKDDVMLNGCLKTAGSRHEHSNADQRNIHFQVQF